MSVWERVERVVDLYDAALKMQVVTGCAWEGELRLTLTNPKDAPSRSVTFFVGGERGPEEAATRLLEDAAAWLDESGQKPLPVPDWLRND